MPGEENSTPTIDACPPDPGTVDRLLGGAHHDPHSVLGAHPHPDGTVVRVLRPHADEVHVVREGGEGYPLVRVHDAGLFSGVVPGEAADYRLAVRYGERVDIVDDPYRWYPTLGDIDLHLIGEGRHERLWDVLGSHVRRYDTPAGTVTGTSFAVWAPTAQGVRVTGDFDGWSGWAHPMRVLGSTGIWELYVPGIEPGTRYKFRILGADGRWRDKADPMAFRTEIPPATASIVDVATHEWNDAEWLETRSRTQAHAAPMSVYEVHLGSWRQGLGYREMAQQLVEYLDETGFTHVELLPVAEHPFGGSWGYQVTSYYAPTARFGTPDDFRWFVDHLHQHGYGVIVDWVPAHFPRDEWALAKFDGTPLYEHADPRRGEQPDWGTLVFDFGRREVRNFLVANALYWLDQFHIDGLRVDAVASMLYLDYSRPEGQWLPNIHGGRENLDAVDFLKEMNATVYRVHPGVVTIAEESTAWPGVSRPTHLGGLGFGFKWNMGWMHDTLDYAGRDPIYRGYHHNQMTFSLMYAFSENFVLPLSHDEVVHGKGSLWERMPGDAWNKAANLRALLAYMWAHPGKQLLFQGQEFGQEREWSEQRSLDWHLLDDPLHGGVKALVGDLNRAYRSLPALWTKDVSPEGFSWIDANDSGGNVLSFLRHGVDAEGRPTVMACVANFSGSPKPDYRVGLPFAGRWREVVNTDAQIYGGSGWGNYGGVEAEQYVWHGRPASAVLNLPPSGVLWLVPEPFEGALRRSEIATAEPPVDTAAEPPVDTAAEPPVDTAAEPPAATAAEPPVDPAAEPPAATAADPAVVTPAEPPVGGAAAAGETDGLATARAEDPLPGLNAAAPQLVGDAPAVDPAAESTVEAAGAATAPTVGEESIGSVDADAPGPGAAGAGGGYTVRTYPLDADSPEADVLEADAAPAPGDSGPVDPAPVNSAPVEPAAAAPDPNAAGPDLTDPDLTDPEIAAAGPAGGASAEPDVDLDRRAYLAAPDIDSHDIHGHDIDSPPPAGSPAGEPEDASALGRHALADGADEPSTGAGGGDTAGPGSVDRRDDDRSSTNQ